MMTDRPSTDEFDALLHRALDDVETATRPDAGLAERLIVNARESRRTVVGLAARRRAKRWALPLLAAATIAVFAAGGAVVANVLSERHERPQPLHSTSAPTPTSPPPTPTSPTPTSPTPTTAAPPAVPHFTAYTVSFLDADHGWALGDAQCATGTRTDCPTLLRTTDGGASWHRAALPPGLVSPFKDGSCMNNGGI